MKILWITLLSIMALNADEIQRINSIVSDITQLRSDYAYCQTKLIDKEIKLKDAKEKNILLVKELDSANSLGNTTHNDNAKVAKLEKMLQEKEVLLKQLKHENRVLLAKVNAKTKSSFPKLVMKEKYKKSNQDDKTKEYFKASAFRLTKESTIYSNLENTFFDTWEAQTSFTSGERTATMIKITGYFVDKTWRKATQEMWVKAENTVKR